MLWVCAVLNEPVGQGRANSAITREVDDAEKWAVCKADTVEVCSEPWVEVLCVFDYTGQNMNCYI